MLLFSSFFVQKSSREIFSINKASEFQHLSQGDQLGCTLRKLRLMNLRTIQAMFMQRNILIEKIKNFSLFVML